MTRSFRIAHRVQKVDGDTLQFWALSHELIEIPQLRIFSENLTFRLVPLWDKLAGMESWIEDPGSCGSTRDNASADERRIWQDNVGYARWKTQRKDIFIEKGRQLRKLE